MADHLVDPREQHVAAVTHLALDRTARHRLVVFELAAESRDLFCAQHIEGEMVALVTVEGDLGVAQHFGHDVPPSLPFRGA